MTFTVSTIAVTFLLLFLIFGNAYSKTWSPFANSESGLKCFQCVRFDCESVTSKSEFCNNANHFIQKSIQTMFYSKGLEFAPCPSLKKSSSGDEDIEWESLKHNPPSSFLCPGACVLGRFQLHSMANGLNETNHGTIMACADSNFVRKIARSNKCHLTNITSTLVNSKGNIFHTMSLENCAQGTDICSYGDFCIHPGLSYVKPFVTMDINKTIDKLTIGIIIVLFIGALILIASFLGMLNK